ncbi:hypothetical protein JZ751_025120 [Albula glossodonta]|uniref:non-specific serine/threonine protein kinase n=1 Tax=Albula glossodonta TaxID=121402 RepID=A0A8T2PGE1_9TELE|nr:hypothetical protein JZ751_025120 [Albula glossodonta]
MRTTALRLKTDFTLDIAVAWPSSGEGNIWLVKRGFLLHVALKFVKKWENEELQLPGQEVTLPREVALMTLVNQPTVHPNVLCLYEWLVTPAAYLLVLEHPEPCVDLHSYWLSQGGALTEGQARPIMAQLLQALQHCQDRV